MSSMTIAAPSTHQERVGKIRAAEILAEHTGWTVTVEDVRDLIRCGLLRMDGRYKGHPLYLVEHLHRLADRRRDLLAQMVTERVTWFAASMTPDTATARLDWRWWHLPEAAAVCGVHLGRWGRYSTADIERLAVSDRFAGERLLSSQQAAEHLEIRPSDWECVLAAGWIGAAHVRDMRVGRVKHVTVPLYRQGDVDALRTLPGIDWEQVRATPAGRPSPLREYAKLPPTRSQIIRWFTRKLRDRYAVETWSWWHNAADTWHLDWDMSGGHPTHAEVAQMLADDPVTAQYLGAIRLGTDVGQVIRYARAMTEPGAAVVLDTETTDLPGRICEIAVVDAATGKVLLNTLVNPQEPITEGAHAVHGLSDEDVAGAPTWGKVLPLLLAVTAGRTVLAYNAAYDQGCITGHSQALGLSADHLDEWANWGCLMRKRSTWCRHPGRIALGGGHRALGDAQDARQILLAMTSPYRPA